jgi:dimethylglycine dehydrogenase
MRIPPQSPQGKIEMVHSEQSSPQHTKAVVIGGGVIGCSILYHLAKAGMTDVTLVEEAQLTSGSTWHAAAAGSTMNGSAMMSWATKRTFELWGEVEEESGQAVGAHRVTSVMIARSQDRMDEIMRLKGVGKRVGIEHELLSPNELATLFPYLNTDTVLGGLRDPRGGHVDPYGLTHAFARAARKRGATVLQDWKVKSLTQTDEGGWIVKGSGGEIHADIIINAAGLYANEVAKLTGAQLPMVNMRHQYLITEPIEEVKNLKPEPPLLRDVDAGVYARREGGGILFGIYEQDSRDFGYEGMPESFVSKLFEPDFDRIAPELEHVFGAIPCTGEHGIRSTVHGPFVFTPDGNPLVGWMPGQKNHFAAAGFLAGISLSGGFGQLISEWIVDGAPHRDMSSCDVLRFGDWAIGDYAHAKAHDTYSTRYKMHFPNEEIEAGRPVRKSPMYDRYAEMGAHFGFADGWERPNWFAGKGVKSVETPTYRRSEAHAAVAAECQAVHTSAGYTDLITFANYLVEGPDAEAFLKRVLPGRVPKKAGRLALSPLVNELGGTMGDATVLRLADDKFMMIASGALSRIHLRTLLPFAEGLDMSFSNRTNSWAGFSVAGPEARTLVEQALEGAASPGFFGCSECTINGVDCVILRLSYVGELSYEIHCALEDQTKLHDALLQVSEQTGIALSAFGGRAMNAMRIEKGLPRTGDELTIEATPFELGMGWMLDLDREGDFVGREALLELREKPLRYRMVTIRIAETEIDPTGGEPLTVDGKLVGYISSGSYCHRVNKSLAMAFVSPEMCQNDQPVTVHILGKEYAGTVSLNCVFDPEGLRARA